SLADHLADREARRPATDGMRTATDAFAATRRVAPGRRWARVVGAGGVAAVLAATIAVAAHRPTSSGPRLNVGETTPGVAAAAPPPAAPARDVWTAAPPGHNVEAHPAPPTPDATPHVASTARGPDRGTPRRGGRARVARTPAGPAAPSNESRL